MNLVSEISNCNVQNISSKTEQLELLPMELSPVKGKTIIADFDGGNISSDAGLIILKEVEKNIGIIKAIEAALTDKRDLRYVEHQYAEMLSQRVFQIASGYEDANDCNSLRDDPILKLCTDKLPLSDTPLASQPTMSRFENTPSRVELYKVAQAMVHNFIDSYTEEPKLMVLDFDDTDNITYGNQQLALFNGYYGETCYMPLHIYEGISGNLILTILKPRRLKGKEILSILKRLIALIRSRFKKTIIIFRGDSHFASPEVMEFSNTQKKMLFVTGLTTKPVLEKQIQAVVDSVKKQYEAKGEVVRQYYSFQYQAGSWSKPMRVVAKIEMNDKSNNPNVRFIVTNAMNARAKILYEQVYSARGNAELFIKDHKLYLKSDRTSCNRFEANQFRLFLHSAAYVLLHSLQHSVLRGTEFANATMQTIQLKLLKIGARVKELKTRVKIEFSSSFAHQIIFRNVCSIFECLRC